MIPFEPIIEVENDGLETPEIGCWGKEKYKLVGHYCNIFTSGMKSKWSNLVYIDLFTGAGIAKVKDEEMHLKTSSLIAASIPNKFTKYIVSDENEENIIALKARVQKYNKYEFSKFHFINADCNKCIDDILRCIPKAKSLLNFCFVDPFKFNVEFNTIRRIANIGRVDFLILLPLQMAGNRNYHNYIDENNKTIDKYIENDKWREPFLNGTIPKQQFVYFLAEQYDANMQSIGYKVKDLKKILIKNTKQVPIYYLAFYSKHDLGNKFFDEIQKTLTPQLNLF